MPAVFACSAANVAAMVLLSKLHKVLYVRIAVAAAAGVDALLKVVAAETIADERRCSQLLETQMKWLTSAGTGCC